MDVSINQRRIYEPNDNSRPTLDKLYWKGVIGEHHIDQNFYNKAMIIMAPSSLFDSDQYTVLNRSRQTSRRVGTRRDSIKNSNGNIRTTPKSILRVKDL
jgi:hypothetical protein